MTRRGFLAALGVGQIASWGTLYYSFPLLAVPMEADLGVDRTALYLAPTIGLLIGSLAAYGVGGLIDRGRGRFVMAGGALLAAVLLVAWSRVESVAALYVVFAGLGLAQAATLYDPAFAVVARRYGAEARKGITALTLWGGFASTVFVPVVQMLLDRMEWREALLVLAAVNLLLCLPLYAAAIDRRHDAPPPAPHPEPDAEAPAPARPAAAWALRQPTFWLLATAFTLYYGTFSALTYHLYPLLLERGLSAEAVVAAIALIGPAQVAGRLFVWMLARDRSVRVVGGATVAALPLALALLLVAEGPVLLATFALLYGAANGIITIVRGVAVPELLTREAYGRLNGLIAVPQTVAKAVAPVAAAALWSLDDSYGPVLLAAVGAAVLVAGAFWAAAAASLRLHRLKPG
ncbi:MFS transporter [Caenispirillum bisanense]|uniref:Sugar phosphate permease n=1 Tax=Caenispirillum bisanense TaxID=414052 RepID=A0A286GKE9_9PROT|nr:MFS transporter [Caenispirillum bisanense]SOD95569.1 Sugar phosphate permease [Caenispirillum bisanense]